MSALSRRGVLGRQQGSGTARRDPAAARRLRPRADLPALRAAEVQPTADGRGVADGRVARAGAAAASQHHPNPGQQILYTPEQAAVLLALPPSWLRRKAAARAIPCRLVGKHLRFSRADLDAITAAAAQPPRPAPTPPTRRSRRPAPADQHRA